MAELAKCDGCKKAYLSGGLIEVRGESNGAIVIYLETCSLDEFSGVGIAYRWHMSFGPDSPCVRAFAAAKQGIAHYCGGCAGPILISALARTLNDTQMRGFHCVECEEGDLPA